MVVEIKEEASAERGSPRLSVLPSLDLALLHALFVSMATKQCHAHALPLNPQATPSSERSLTRSPVGRVVPNLGAQSLHLFQAWGQGQDPSPHLSGTFQTPQPGQCLPCPEKAAAAVLGMTWIARDLSAHLAFSLSLSCQYSGPLLAWALLMTLRAANHKRH